MEVEGLPKSSLAKKQYHRCYRDLYRFPLNNRFVRSWSVAECYIHRGLLKVDRLLNAIFTESHSSVINVPLVSPARHLRELCTVQVIKFRYRFLQLTSYRQKIAITQTSINLYWFWLVRSPNVNFITFVILSVACRKKTR